MNALREQPARGEAPWVPTGKEMDGEKACAAAAAATQSANGRVYIWRINFEKKKEQMLLDEAYIRRKLIFLLKKSNKSQNGLSPVRRRRSGSDRRRKV